MRVAPDRATRPRFGRSGAALAARRGPGECGRRGHSQAGDAARGALRNPHPSGSPWFIARGRHGLAGWVSLGRGAHSGGARSCAAAVGLERAASRLAAGLRNGPARVGSTSQSGAGFWAARNPQDRQDQANKEMSRASLPGLWFWPAPGPGDGWPNAVACPGAIPGVGVAVVSSFLPPVSGASTYSVLRCQSLDSGLPVPGPHKPGPFYVQALPGWTPAPGAVQSIWG
jgi:hypothetical protein